MNERKKDLINAMIGKLVKAFPTQMEDGTVDIYEEYLADVPDEDLRLAVNEVIATAKFFPRVAEIREKAVEIRLRREGVPHPADAWAEVQREIRAKGFYEKPEFSHPMVREAMLAVGGWTHLTGPDDPNMETVRAQYLRIYDSMVSRLKHDRRLLPDTRRWIEAGETTPALPETEGQDYETKQALPETVKALAGKMKVRR